MSLPSPRVARARIGRARGYGGPQPLNAATVLTAVAVALAAALAGWVGAAKLTAQPEPAAAPADTPTRIGAADALVRAGWTPVARAPRLAGLDGAGVRAFAPPAGGAGRMLVAVRAADHPSLVPRSLIGALEAPLPTARRATVAGMRALAYPALTVEGTAGLADLYVVPTTAGVLTVACLAPLREPLPDGSCPQALMRAEIADGRPVLPSPNAALMLRAPAAIAALDTARVRERAALRRGRTPAAQSASARSVASAFGTASAAIADVAPAGGPGAALRTRLGATRAAYERLAAAARRRDRAGWARAGAAVRRAEAALAAELRSL
jgi:hypothetical protein